jgi:hypothetical protein
MVIKISKKAIIIPLSFLLIYYSYCAIRFNNKVRLYNTKVQIGMNETYVWALLGPPSYGDWNILKETSVGEEQRKRRSILYVYRGIYFLRDDIILYFDYETGKLFEKSRGMHFSRIEF